MNRGNLIATWAIFLALATIASTSECPAGEESPVRRIKMTMSDLRAQGISIGASSRFPNSCEAADSPAMSLSNEILAHFESRGFSLLTLCLGLNSIVRYDRETGRQLPLAFLPELAGGTLNTNIPLNLPDCYRNAVPRVECEENFNWYSGTKEEKVLPPGYTRRDDQKDDANIRKYIKATRVRGIIYRFDRATRLPGVEIDPYIMVLVASDALARGYGYSERCCEGADPEPEDVSLSTYRKQRDGSSLWSDER
jgi:hypothetical protein